VEIDRTGSGLSGTVLFRAELAGMEHFVPMPVVSGIGGRKSARKNAH
jgi:hypothetical protein